MSQDKPQRSDPNQPQDLSQPGDQHCEANHRVVGRLQLELRRVRSRATAARLEATVARLEARAAELEWMLARAAGDAAPHEPRPDDPTQPDARQDAQRDAQRDAQPSPPPQPVAAPTAPLQQSPAESPAEPCTEPPDEPPVRIDNWDTLAAAAARRCGPHPANTPGLAITPAPPNAPEKTPATPATPATTASTAPAARGGAARQRGGGRKQRPVHNADAGQPLPRRPRPPVVTSSPPGEPRRGRKKPAAWLLSMAVHAGLLLILAGLTLSVHNPQDQIAFTASAATSSEPQNLQMLEMESLIEPAENDPREPSERPVELDDLGAVPLPPAVDLPDLPTEFTAPSPPASSLLDSAEMMTALTSDSENTTRFCGVEGGGNHFVYIVDSSQSMKNGRFESARRELLQAIDTLQQQQRFYIIFYDIHLDRMCVSHPTEPDEFSLLATDENKRRARRWAMSVQLEQGAPPDAALSFALKLRPDVIFLLSDGEFPQRIEDLMAERNRTSNLFGDAGPISILHTIGYHSRDGETRMRRLADANGGQYRYIPAP